MCKILKNFITTCIMFSILMIPAACFGANSLEEEIQPSINQVKVTIINSETGESKTLLPEEVKQIVSPHKSLDSSDSTNQSVDYEFYIPIDNGIVPRTSEEHNTDELGIKARLAVNYDLSSDLEEIRVNKVYGSWIPTNSIYYVTDRLVGAHNGVGWGTSKLLKNPTTNSFSYTTGWEYHLRLGGTGAPRAWSEATINVVGMSATYRVVVEFTYSV